MMSVACSIVVFRSLSGAVFRAAAASWSLISGAALPIDRASSRIGVTRATTTRRSGSTRARRSCRLLVARQDEARRLEPSGQIWVVTTMKKVRGPETPAIHRLELADLLKAFAPHGFRQDHEARLSAWHVAYRFVKRETGNAKRIRD